jgi:NAD(P)H:quinone oxidoreductase type IV
VVPPISTSEPPSLLQPIRPILLCSPPSPHPITHNDDSPTNTSPSRIAETLPQEVLSKMYAPAKSDYPTVEPHDLEAYDAFLFGIPTRYGNFPAQWKTFWDKTGGQWQAGKYWGKYAGFFISTGTLGGGQESTAIAAMSTMAHHGIIYVPLGYKTAFPLLADLSEVRGGTPWGAGTFAVCIIPPFWLQARY